MSLNKNRIKLLQILLRVEIKSNTF